MTGNIILLVTYSIWCIIFTIGIIKELNDESIKKELFNIYEKISLCSILPLIIFTIIIFMIFDK